MSITGINDLSVDVLQNIFSRLPGMHATIVKVCRLWRKVEMENIQTYGMHYLRTPDIRELLPDADAPRTDVELLKYVKKITRFFEVRYYRHPEIEQGKPIPLPRGPLDPEFLQLLIRQTKERERISDQNLVMFFNGLRERLPDLSAIPQNLTIVEQAEFIRVWMNKNQARLNQITALDLPSLHLTELPPESQYFANLRTLSLFNNKIAAIPSWIDHFKYLHFLDLSNNEISFIPPEIGHLENLLCMDLGINKISDIPLEFANLKNLQKVQLENNQLTKDAMTIIENFWRHHRECVISI